MASGASLPKEKHTTKFLLTFHSTIKEAPLLIKLGQERVTGLRSATWGKSGLAGGKNLVHLFLNWRK